MLIDSHAHIYDEKYAGGGKAIIESMAADNLEHIVCVGCDMESSRTCAELAKNNNALYAVIGVHPYDAETVTPENLAELKRLALTNDKVVAIGEIGLDFHYDGADRQGQVEAMRMQYELANELKLPTVYHIRDGFGEFYEFAKARKFEYGAVLHCFSGSAEIAEYYVKKGFYISFAGTVTYKNAVGLARAAAAVPIERLLIETDSPYLSPEPFRGKTNYPKNVALVARRLAEIKGIPVAEVEIATTENAKHIFNIK